MQNEFIVEMDIAFPSDMPPSAVTWYLAEEAKTCEPYFASGAFSRAWRTYGEHTGNHGHMALWEFDGTADDLKAVYRTFPLVYSGFATNVRIRALQDNPNDRETKFKHARESMWGESRPVPLTWDALYARITEDIKAGTAVQRMRGEVAYHTEIAPGVTIHIHPESGNPRDIHFMVDGKKTAEIGPASPTPDGMHEDNVPGYISFLAEWDGLPVRNDVWKRQILADNGL